MNEVSIAPVLFIIFNRPDLTKLVFAHIREAKPAQLFIAADGPRTDRPLDAQACIETRRIIEQIDWSCELHTLFRDENLGCKRGVRTAIDWFFENVEQGIILEDDCVPAPTFFRFCAELLEIYRFDDHVAMIGGSNFQFGRRRGNASYYFSRNFHVWGWASWRRAWKNYDGNMEQWPRLRETNWLLQCTENPAMAERMDQVFQKCFLGQVDTWDYQWLYSCWHGKKVSIIPNVNLISNIGFVNEATHTKKSSFVSNIPLENIKFPLHHPKMVMQDQRADQFTFNYVSLNKEPPTIYGSIIHIPKKIYASLPETGQNIYRSIRDICSSYRDKHLQE